MLRAVSAVLIAAALPCAVGFAQEPAADTTAQALYVFLDCNAPNCDFDHFRREITWVNWVRDRQDSDIHLLVTSQRTGGGGWHYTLDYLGRREFVEQDRSLSYTSDPDDTDAEVRENLTQTIALGLVRFVDNSPIAPRLRVTYQEPPVAVVQREEHDPWNLWVFQIRANGSLNGEAQQSRYSLGGSASASRVAEDFKVSLRTSGRYSRQEFELDDDDVYVDVSEDYSVNLDMVWSLGDHWSGGGAATASRSTYYNRDLGIFLGPALEYNIFPYDESTRRQLTFLYTAQLAAFNYELVTVDGKTEQILPRHTLSVSASVQQPWGRVFGSIGGTQYLHDLRVHSINTFAFFEYRLFRGLNFNLSGGISRIKDQFYLPSEGLTDEEILLRRRARETDFRFNMRVGFSYRFGSKFANIVNPRMGGEGGEIMFFF
ncbi:MAG: hypothetical protein JSW71_08350 [Gemmatimonadota bacterium]|nr:MAG: hypothetical protein JSW71_08350 [Gemmatimonadota bacterium]